MFYESPSTLKSDLQKEEEERRANEKYRNGSKFRTVIGTRKWIIRSITELNAQNLEEKATENSKKSETISTTEALSKMITCGAVEYSKKYQKHVAEIFWFPYVLDNDMHGTTIGGKQSQFYSKSEKRFICTGKCYQFPHQAMNLVHKFFYNLLTSALRKRCLAWGSQSCRSRRTFDPAYR